DPIAGDGAKITINSVYGLGEGLVSGLLDADTFIVHKESGQIEKRDIAHKDKQLLRAPEGAGLIESAVAESMQDAPSLTDAEIQALADLGKKVEGYYRFPQDIEWGFAQGQFYLLQSRPVT